MGILSALHSEVGLVAQVKNKWKTLDFYLLTWVYCKVYEYLNNVFIWGGGEGLITPRCAQGLFLGISSGVAAGDTQETIGDVECKAGILNPVLALWWFYENRADLQHRYQEAQDFLGR